MRISLLDPGLSSTAGHHLEWNRRLVGALVERGHSVRVYTHRLIDADACRAMAEHAEVTPLFRVSPYLRPSLVDPVLTPGLRAFDPLAGPISHFIDGANLLTEDIRNIDPDSDLQIWPSLFPNQLLAQSAAKTLKDCVACIQVDSFFGGSATPMFWRFAWLKSQAANVPIRFGVTVPELQKDYASVFVETLVRTWPICVDANRLPAPRSQLSRIGFFGEQRGEKGVTLLQQVVRPLLAQGLEVVVHDSGNLVSGEGTGNLIRLGYVADITTEIGKCDLIVAPYEPAAYVNRGSGIVWEAIACGVPVVVPAQSAPGRFALALGAAVGLGEVSVEAILNGVANAHHSYKMLAENAFLASQRWSESHGSGRFADALLAPV